MALPAKTYIKMGWSGTNILENVDLYFIFYFYYLIIDILVLIINYYNIFYNLLINKKKLKY